MKTLRALTVGRAMMLLFASGSPFTARAADIPTALPPSAIPKVPVPKSPYIAVVYRYADTMLAKGRDTYGPQKTGLLLSALDRTTLAPLPKLPAAPAGVVEGGRRVHGANAQHDQNLLRLLYTLSELTLKPVYREAADAELKWLLENTGSPFLRWDTVQDELDGSDNGSLGPWLLWDRCFDLAPEPAGKFAVALRDRINDPRQAVFPHQAGLRIRTYAVAYARTKDEQFLQAITARLDRLDKSPDSRRM